MPVDFTHRLVFSFKAVWRGGVLGDGGADGLAIFNRELKSEEQVVTIFTALKRKCTELIYEHITILVKFIVQEVSPT